MSPISVRLDEAVRKTLERDALSRGIGLATYLRELAAERATRVRREEIREQSRLVGQRAAADPRMAGFYDEIGFSSPPFD